jgi:ABC-type phosphate/phosphonate transport system substrate-binding protein
MKSTPAFSALLACLVMLPASWVSKSLAAEATPEETTPLTMVVMDPLALPLSCPCVKGYAQRKYEKLAEQLETSLHRPVKIFFNESLTAALKDQTDGKVDLIIGKCSVVEFDAKNSGRSIAKLAMLSDKEGVTTQTGLIVVPTDDPAKSPADLKEYRIIFGPPECDEKHNAVLALLKKHGVDPPAKLETSPACSDGACLILEAGPDVRGAAAISSYARPLLEGCGTVKKGALRVVGTTEPVPFIGAFAVGASAAEQQHIAAALIKATEDPVLRVALETRDGFVAADSPPPRTAKKK